MSHHEPGRSAGLLSPDEQNRLLQDVLRLSDVTLMNHPRREEFLAYQDPISDETRALLEKLRARQRCNNEG